MADFFSNLLLRSAAEPFPSAVLQPRLPALFEPPAGKDEVPLPAPEPVLRETIGPANEPAAVNVPILQAPVSRSAIAVEPPERQPAITPVESRHPSEQTAQTQATEPQQELIQPVPRATPSPRGIIQPIQFTSRLEEPQRTIMPRSPVPPTRRDAPAIEDPHSLTPQERGKISSDEPVPVEAQKLEMIPLEPKRHNDPLSVVIRPLKEDSLLEDSAHPGVEPLPAKTGPEPLTVLQPVPAASRPARTQPLEPAHPPAPQRVVEIHIGRIEVRATPPPAPLKRAPQKAATMSLEEYLRSRPGEKP